MALLVEKGLSRSDVLSVMLVLSSEEKGKKMLSYLKEEKELDSDAICKRAGEIAFGENT